jgi:hypothetical protein
VQNGSLNPSSGSGLAEPKVHGRRLHGDFVRIRGSRAYARRLFHQVAVPEVDAIEGLPPAVGLQSSADHRR